MTKEELTKYCAGGPPSIKEPFSQGDKSYATDGHIIVRVSRLKDVEERKDTPDVEKLFGEAFVPCDLWEKIPDLPEPVYEQCCGCGGTGCGECGGKGKHEVPRVTQIGGQRFQNRYLRMIKELPNHQFHAAAGEAPAIFKFKDGDGLLMPMRFPG